MDERRIRKGSATGGCCDFTPEFSFFYGPAGNVTPACRWRPYDVYNYVRSDYARLRTELLRSPMDGRNRMAYLNTAFDFVTFAGVFRERAEFAIVQPSGYVVFHLLDVDVKEAKRVLRSQTVLKTVLIFTDVFGSGLVWVVRNDSGKSHVDFWREMAFYVYDTFGYDVEIDFKTLSSVCFLPYDRSAYISPEYLNGGRCFVNDIVNARSGD